MERLVGAVIGDKNAITILKLNEGIYIENKSEAVKFKRELLGFSGASFIKVNEASELVKEIKEYKPEAIGIIYNSISGLMKVYKMLDEHHDEIECDLADMKIYAELRKTEAEAEDMTGLETKINRSNFSAYPNIIDKDLPEVSIDIYKYNKYKLKCVAELVGSLMKHYYKAVVCIRKINNTNLIFGRLRYNLKDTTAFLVNLGIDYSMSISDVDEHINKNYKYFRIEDSIKYEKLIMSEIEYAVSNIPLTIIQKWANRGNYSSYGAKALAIEQVGEMYKTKALCKLIDTLYKERLYTLIINIDNLDYLEGQHIFGLVYAENTLNKDEIDLRIQKAAQKCTEEIVKEIEDRYKAEKEQFKDFYKALEN